MITPTAGIQIAIAQLIKDSDYKSVEPILTALIESGIVDEEYPNITTDDGQYNSEMDLAVQYVIIKEIEKQLN